MSARRRVTDAQRQRFPRVIQFTVAVSDKADLTANQLKKLMRSYGVKHVDELCSEDEWTALLEASMAGNAAAVTALLAAKADANKARRSDGVVPLYLATERMHVDCVQALIAAGADVNRAKSDSGYTPLLVATEKGRDDLGADARRAMHTGAHPLWMAAQCGHADLLPLLIGANADIDARGCTKGTTPLLIAAQFGRARCVAALIKARANLNALYHDGTSAVMLAANRHHADCVELLVKAGAEVKPTYMGQFSAVDVAGGDAEVLGQLRKVCSACKKGLRRTFKCAQCVSVAYCSEECQQAAWPEHKEACVKRRQCDGCRWGITSEAATITCCCSSKAYCDESCRLLAWPKHKDECTECHGCRKRFETSALKKCAACKSVHYCSVDCQAQGWKAGHKAECKKAQAAAATAKANYDNVFILSV